MSWEAKIRCHVLTFRELHNHILLDVCDLSDVADIF
jgi:hypothetical protein